MGRKRLLTILAGVIAAIGLGAGTATAQVSAPGVGSVTVEAEDELAAEVDLDAEIGDETLEPTVTAKVSPSGPEVSVEPTGKEDRPDGQDAPRSSTGGGEPPSGGPQDRSRVRAAGDARQAVAVRGESGEFERAARLQPLGAHSLMLGPVEPARIGPPPPHNAAQPPRVAPPAGPLDRPAEQRDAALALTPADHRDVPAAPLALKLLTGALVLAGAAAWNTAARQRTT